MLSPHGCFVNKLKSVCMIHLRCTWEAPGLGSSAGKGPGWGVQCACQPAGIGEAEEQSSCPSSVHSHPECSFSFLFLFVPHTLSSICNATINLTTFAENKTFEVVMMKSNFHHHFLSRTLSSVNTADIRKTPSWQFLASGDQIRDSVVSVQTQALYSCHVMFYRCLSCLLDLNLKAWREFVIPFGNGTKGQQKLNTENDHWSKCEFKPNMTLYFFWSLACTGRSLHNPRLWAFVYSTKAVLLKANSL